MIQLISIISLISNIAIHFESSKSPFLYLDILRHPADIARNTRSYVMYTEMTPTVNRSHNRTPISHFQSQCFDPPIATDSTGSGASRAPPLFITDTMAHLHSTTGLPLLQRLLRPPTVRQIAYKSTTTTASDLDLDAALAGASAAAAADAAGAVLLQPDAERLAHEQHVERLRNKSRLLPQHRRMLNAQLPYAEPQSWIHTTVKYQRMQFGRHGVAAVDPRLCFPTPTERATRAEWERVAFPQTLPEVSIEPQY